MTRSPAEQHAMDDQACIWLLTRTSIKDPRDVLMDCARCHRPFFAHYRNAVLARYCSTNCCTRAWQDRNRERFLAGMRAYCARQRAMERQRAARARLVAEREHAA